MSSGAKHLPKFNLHREKNFLLLAILAALFLNLSCTELKVQEERKHASVIGVNEKISFILDRSLITDVKDAPRIERKIENCIDNALRELDSPIQTVSAEIFRNTVFPDMDYLSVPSSPDSIHTLVKSPEFQKRIKPLGLRYLFILQSESNTSQLEWGGLDGLVIWLWDKKTQMSASIIDLAKGFDAGGVTIEAGGTNWIVYFALPFGFPAITEGPACRELGKQIVNFVTVSRQTEK